MANVLAIDPSPELSAVIADLWFSHRTEEKSLARLAEAALLAAELLQRLPNDMQMITGLREDSPYPGADIAMIRLALVDTYCAICQHGKTELQLQQLQSLFSSVRLNSVTYDFIAMRLLASGALANASQATSYIQFKSAKRQFAATLDQCLLQLSPYIKILFQQYNATRYLSSIAANDIARQVLRRYVHEANKPVNASEFVDTFIRLYRARLESSEEVN